MDDKIRITREMMEKDEQLEAIDGQIIEMSENLLSMTETVLSSLKEMPNPFARKFSLRCMLFKLRRNPHKWKYFQYSKDIRQCIRCLRVEYYRKRNNWEGAGRSS